MNYLTRVQPFVPPDLDAYLPFRVYGRDLGSVTPAFAAHLAPHTDVFRVTDQEVALVDALKTYDQRTAAVERVLKALHKSGAVPGWRDERYRVCTSFSAPPLFAIDRGSVPLLGVRAYGVHLNGYVRDRNGLRMWLGRRSRDRTIEPGKLDQIVAGGQPAGLGVVENLIKESAEEASIPAALAAQAKPAGALFYTIERPEGLRRDVLFIYDLELPADFVPHNDDGETESFELLPIEEVAAIVRETDDFKFNCALVVIDFLIRHGLIGPDEPGYAEIVAIMHCWA
jgi:8-oxo-dGTP pyrophosphatase MutT (NUDIX family)